MYSGRDRDRDRCRNFGGGCGSFGAERSFSGDRQSAPNKGLSNLTIVDRVTTSLRSVGKSLIGLSGYS